MSGAAVGGDGTPNVFEEPFTLLDVSVRQELFRAKGRHPVYLTVRGRNLLAPDQTTFYKLPRVHVDESGTVYPLTEVKSSHATARRYALGLSVVF